MTTSHPTRPGLAALVTAVTAAMTPCAQAAITGFVGDTTLEGGWFAFEDTFDVDMTVIHHGGATYETVTGIDVPEFGGSLDFDSAHSLRIIGSGWATWSHGYTGEVFYNNGKYFVGYDLKMNGVHAFDAYVEPNGGGDSYAITAYGSGGGEATVEFWAYWSYGAMHFGFYAPDERIVRFEIDSTGDWAIGEWRVGVPAPGSLALLALAGTRRRRR